MTNSQNDLSTHRFFRGKKKIHNLAVKLKTQNWPHYWGVLPGMKNIVRLLGYFVAILTSLAIYLAFIFNLSLRFFA